MMVGKPALRWSMNGWHVTSVEGYRFLLFLGFSKVVQVSNPGASAFSLIIGPMSLGVAFKRIQSN